MSIQVTFGGMEGKKLNLIQVNLAILMWGGTAMFAKGIKLPPEHIICIRSFLGAIGLVIIMAILKIPVRMKEYRHYGIMLTLAILMGVHWVTYFKALQISTAAVAILALHVYPVITTLAEPFLFKEKLKLRDVITAIIVFLGLLIMTPEFSLQNQETQGIIFGVISGIFLTGRNLMTRKYIQIYSSYTLMFWQMIIVSILLFPVLFFMESETYNGETITLLIVLGVLFTAIPHTLYSASFRHLSAKTVGIFGLLLPFYGAVFGYFIHQENVSLRTIIGGLIIIACVIFETMQNVKK